MQITYRIIDQETLGRIREIYGEMVVQHIHLEEGSYSVAALYDGVPVGLISTYIRSLTSPLDTEKDAYIDIIEVLEQFRRQGIASEMIRLTEEWALKAGLFKICAWSSRNKVEALSMWRDLGYGLCPAKIWPEWAGEAVDGCCVVKQLNRKDPFPDNTHKIKRELLDVSGKPVHSFHLLRAKDGVYVYRCLYDGIPTIAKYFAHDGDKREIQNYRLLMECGIPTIRTYALGASVIVMEDISLSKEWRLGTAEDMNDISVARGLARWYFALHEAGADVAGLNTLYFEYNAITRESLDGLRRKLPEASELFSFLLERFNTLRALIDKQECTLTYNDFYWTNFAVSKDGQEALMFDYNLLGRGWRYSDFRNVSSLSGDAYQQFVEEYNLLYFRKHGYERTLAEQEEERIDSLVSPLFELMAAFEQGQFPSWAIEAKQAVLDGTLMQKAKRLLIRSPRTFIMNGRK